MITFSYNWNNKLDCKMFTTVRLQSDKYQIGHIHDIILKGKSKGEGKIVAVKVKLLSQIDEFETGLDTGYNQQDFRKLIMTMYKNTVKDWSTQKLLIILIRKKK